jgi:hypothetical protein
MIWPPHHVPSPGFGCRAAILRAPVVYLLTPLFGVMAGGFTNELITGMLMLALVLVGSGIYLVNRPSAA